jgi:hypothetical protein
MRWSRTTPTKKKTANSVDVGGGIRDEFAASLKNLCNLRATLDSVLISSGVPTPSTAPARPPPNQVRLGGVEVRCSGILNCNHERTTVEKEIWNVRESTLSGGQNT